ncbi:MULTISPECIES: cytochrome c biogenesis protein CcdC [unclassified Geobacillus]|uniref:Cytochrome c biogenesis protein CcdC n=1 Tax=Geobacillus sp. (strain WCH70) TaxID=471223 RepID=C5D9L6_GEOSW|nr:MULTISPECIES: cytochrome c biogenesis protein CcdC [unclassified Geobacillus]PDM40433.1 cytochrome c biogenesis protein CcdC [Parageobacillus yumthangensis]RDV21143.1 cytochrome c biogenesis protein CcdC [Parageobacillus toebii]TXK89831.1 cytochrome c biogenesis protein CcdC [Parageobacillus sp. SY1]PUF89082.1 cytochrome c biogenesis protein CcdC [Geobacillus sp. LYN3]TXK89104.1 cytochrome c biogenesis protein CcdC [Geobacillus sp. AYS3]
MAIVSSIVAVFMALLVLFVRMKASNKPTNAKKIILPPIFMSTGALMFIDPVFRVTKGELIEAVVLGAFFSIFLIKTSKFEIRNGKIYLKRSKAFIFILVGLIVIRLGLKTYLGRTIDYRQLSGMFYLLAFSMIVPWRVAMYITYKKLERRLKHQPPILTT